MIADDCLCSGLVLKVEKLQIGRGEPSRLDFEAPEKPLVRYLYGLLTSGDGKLRLAGF